MRRKEIMNICGTDKVEQTTKKKRQNKKMQHKEALNKLVLGFTGYKQHTNE